MFTYLVECQALDLLFEVVADSDLECAEFAASVLFDQGMPQFRTLNLTLANIKLISDFEQLLALA